MSRRKKVSELPVDEKDAPEGYYAVDVGRGCAGCDLASKVYAHVCGSANCDATQRADKNMVIFKKLPKRSAGAEKKLYIHSEDGHVVLAFEGELQYLPRIAILNYTDDLAKDIAQHMMALWNENADKIEMGERNGC
jgi:hypothetical protein